jgi:hypothetical protein
MVSERVKYLRTDESSGKINVKFFVIKEVKCKQNCSLTFVHK